MKISKFKVKGFCSGAGSLGSLGGLGLGGSGLGGSAVLGVPRRGRGQR